MNGMGEMLNGKRGHGREWTRTWNGMECCCMEIIIRDPAAREWHDRYGLALTGCRQKAESKHAYESQIRQDALGMGRDQQGRNM